MDTNLHKRSLDASAKLGDLATQHGAVLATAESCTGGLISTYLTHHAGSSNYFLGGLCAYSNDAKIRLLQVPTIELEKYGAVSEKVALSMLKGAMHAFRANCGISVTGIAGPGGGSKEKPVGMICCALAAWERFIVKTYFLDGQRQENRQQICALSLEDLADLIELEADNRR